MVANNDGVNCRIRRLIKARGLCAGLIRRRRRNPSDSIMNRMGDLGLNLTIALFLFFSSEIDGCKLAAALDVGRAGATHTSLSQLLHTIINLPLLMQCGYHPSFFAQRHSYSSYTSIDKNVVFETFVKTSKPKSLLTCFFVITV